MSRQFKIYSKTVRPELKPREWQKDWFEYIYKDVKKSTGKGEDDFEIEIKEEIKYTNIDEHIASFKDECGVRAVMKKIALTGDMSLLDESSGEYLDLSQIPDLPQDKLAAYKKAEDAFAAIDPELRGSMSMEEFIKSMDASKIKAYIDSKFAESKEAKKAEGEEK